VTLSIPVLPMKAAIGLLPAEPDDHGWAYEIKWDGYRTIVVVDVPAKRVRVQSSSGLDVTATYPELGGMWADVHAERVVLDGEIIVFGADGLPSFEGLQRHETQVVLQAFDVLSVDGHDVIDQPYEERRALLREVLDDGNNWTVPGHRIGGGAELLEAAVQQGLEGVMAKRLGSRYLPGKRSPNWRKVKNRRRVDVVIGGFTPGTGNRSGTFGSLLVGVPLADGTLAFAGGVGTGFSQLRLEVVLRLLRERVTDACPFEPVPPRTHSRSAVWVRPDLTAHIEIAEFTNEGYVRHASFVGLDGHDLPR
jgi:bifunctional non-homologous end joining protein LigD